MAYDMQGQSIEQPCSWIEIAMSVRSCSCKHTHPAMCIRSNIKLITTFEWAFEVLALCSRHKYIKTSMS